MSAADCARAASDLTSLVNRLRRAGRSLDRQGRLPADDFGGLSGDAFRRRAERSALTVAGLASDLALLAGALAALGRDLETADGLRAHEAQDAWRQAVARFEGRTYEVPGVDQPVTTEPPTEPETDSTTSPYVTPPESQTTPAEVAAAPPQPTPATPEPALVSDLVPPPLESEIVPPPVKEPRCGTLPLSEAQLNPEGGATQP